MTSDNNEKDILSLETEALEKNNSKDNTTEESEKSATSVDESKEESKETTKDKEESKGENNSDSKEEPKSNAELLDGNSNEQKEPYVDSSVGKYKKKKKIFKWILVALIVSLAVVYISGVFYFSTHFDKGTYLNEYDISNKSIEEVEEIFEKEFSEYELNVVFKDCEETIKQGDGSLEFYLEESVENIKTKQNHFLWFVNIFEEDNYTVNYKAYYNKDNMADYISNFECMNPDNMVKSKDASVRMSEGEVIVTPDVTGTQLDEDKVLECITAALDGYSGSVNIDENDCYVKADILEDSDYITERVANAEKYLSIEAYYDFNGHLVPISREDLSTMAYLDSWGDVVISKSNVELYAHKFAEENTTSYTERKFLTNDGRTILIYGGYYGWILDGEKEAEELYEALLTQEDFTKKPACKKEGYAHSDLNDIGDTYVEIDLSDQKVYMYVDGLCIVETDCVTGSIAGGMKTPGGLYQLNGKDVNATLRGPGYASFVYFWMPFNGGIGLHDATWRDAFGGDIYQYDGSHGCINLPYEAAEKIYNNIEYGMPIVCYWDDEVVEVKE
ncbi:MAG: hypothetical protein E7258_03255 [Lachnospiraceae bacterium]|nr:hypothetical protein [Lachnospiraceae bacterium]